MAIFNSGNRDAGLAVAAHAATSGGKRGLFLVIGTDVVITGNIAASADLHVDGRIDGDIDCANLVQGSENIITGAVKAETARLAGAIEGSVNVRQVTVERAARIHGDVEYDTISIETAATIDGRLKHRTQTVLPALSGPNPAEAA